ncbi:hypothetical protein QFC19_001298 [Naganishia cerealis]|uniref:Uncharacterized protein n=1 Tax=Naganishia cerealis TaxID=610337 RepID=A0ACC2WH23_9TREE|nr:hypothetical protein QFC19_001298 [Naganishia cerealis]
MSNLIEEDQGTHSSAGPLETTGNSRLDAAENERPDVADDEQDPEAGEMTYEEQRLATIRHLIHLFEPFRANQELLKSLGLAPTAPSPHQPSNASTASSRTTPSVTPTNKAPKRTIKREVLPVEPVRKSSRLSAAAKAKEKEESRIRKRKHKRPKLERNASSLTPLSGNASSSYEDDTSSEDASTTATNRKSVGRVSLPPGEQIRIPMSIEYAVEGISEEYYATVQPIPQRENGDKGRLVFEGRWKGVFVPNLTPEEVFRGGAFGGNYYADVYSGVLKTNLLEKEDVTSLPQSWLRPSSPATDDGPVPFSPSTHLTAPTRDPSVNRYGVAAGQGLKEWEKSGWIWKGDPRGWMQWYVRFYNGRRCVDDERQVQRCEYSSRFVRSRLGPVCSLLRNVAFMHIVDLGLNLAGPAGKQLIYSETSRAVA